MHLLIPHVSALSEASAHTLRDLTLPNLARLMTVLQATTRDVDDEYTLSPPHERALATAHGWHGADGCWPWAALQARGDRVGIGKRPWGLLTPVHWHVGREHITLADPSALDLPAEESRALFDAVRPLFEDDTDDDQEGGSMTWAAPTRWYLAHDHLVDLPCASIDRVIGRNVDLWLRGDPQASAEQLARVRWVRRLQNEVQMLLHQHPVNEAREERGALPVNSFWLSGCGTAQAARAQVTVDTRLRAPLLAEDWAGWADAWRSLDADALGPLAAAAARGESVTLTLCGERGWQRHDAMPRSIWQRLSDRFRTVEPHTLLSAL
ncbi:MAG: hypothetical protein Q7T97_05715 [Burkholderiaceae bacterium]|nr:hypothetical protein [Burkholderiaceae bacterium]